MSKEKQIQEYQSKQLIDELSKMPPMVIATAYLHAINYTLYGEDITEKWLTATQNARILEKAYKKGYYDALQRLEESKQIPFQEFKARRVIPNYMADIEGDIEGVIEHAKQAVTKDLFYNIKDNITYKVDAECITPTITASIFIGRKEQ